MITERKKEIVNVYLSFKQNIASDPDKHTLLRHLYSVFIRSGDKDLDLDLPDYVLPDMIRLELINFEVLEKIFKKSKFGNPIGEEEIANQRTYLNEGFSWLKVLQFAGSKLDGDQLASCSKIQEDLVNRMLTSLNKFHGISYILWLGKLHILAPEHENVLFNWKSEINNIQNKLPQNLNESISSEETLDVEGLMSLSIMAFTHPDLARIIAPIYNKYLDQSNDFAPIEFKNIDTNILIALINWSNCENSDRPKSTIFIKKLDSLLNEDSDLDPKIRKTIIEGLAINAILVGGDFDKAKEYIDMLDNPYNVLHLIANKISLKKHGSKLLNFVKEVLVNEQNKIIKKEGIEDTYKEYLLAQLSASHFVASIIRYVDLGYTDKWDSSISFIWELDEVKNALSEITKGRVDDVLCNYADVLVTAILEAGDNLPQVIEAIDSFIERAKKEDEEKPTGHLYTLNLYKLILARRILTEKKSPAQV